MRPRRHSAQNHSPRRRRFAAIAASVAVTASGSSMNLVLITRPARAAAQEPPAAAANAAAPARQRSLQTVLDKISQAAGVQVVADSTVSQAQVTPPAEPTTPENFTRQIEAIVKTLPAGTTWAKLYLPAPASSRGYRGDDVAQYALAQARLFGNVGGATPAGTVEIMGQKIAADRAEAFIAGLNLKPVYLVTNPRGPGIAMNDAQWTSMTPEQKRAYAEQQAQQFLAMDPNARNEFFQKNFMIFGQVMRMLPPDQRGMMFGGTGVETRVILRTPNGEQITPGGNTNFIIAPAPAP